MNDKNVKIISINNISPILKSVLESNSCIKLNVTGNSMYPLLRNNIDAVILMKKANISKYDILLYQRKNGDYILHRVVKIKNNVLSMAGDYETTIECPIYQQQVIATVASFYRNGKHISCTNMLYRLYNFIWVALLPKRRVILNKLKKMRCAVRSRGRKIL